MTNVEDTVNKEYIDKHEAYLLLKQKAKAYMLHATKEAYEKAAILIDSLPTIEADPAVHGHWIKGHCGVDEYIKCSVCRTRIVNTIVSLEGDTAEDYFDLCPKCGARMDGGSE